MTKEDIIARLQAEKPSLMQKYPIHRLALFGSWARGEQSPASDVDILVDADPSIGLRFVTLAREIENLVNHKVDLVSRRALKPALWTQIEKELIDA